MTTLRILALPCLVLTGAASCSLAGLAEPTGASSSSGDPTYTGSPDAGILLEAEDAVLNGNFLVADDPLASDGKYVYIPDTDGCSSSAGTSSVTFHFAVGATGNYRVWARMLSPDNDHESFFVSADVTTGSPALLRLTDYKTWVELAVYDDSVAVQAPIPYAWDAGPHTITFACRSDGTQLDRIRILLAP